MRNSPALPIRFVGLLLAAAGALAQVGIAVGAAPRFEITFDTSVSDKPYTGRVYVVTARGAYRSPLDGVNWFNPQPLFAQDVENWGPGEVLRFDPEKCLGYPHDLARLPKGSYRVQAVMDLNGWSHDVIKAPGNGFSNVVKLVHRPDEPATVKLRVGKTLPALNLTDTDEVKYVRLKSRRLSKFHGRDVYLHAAAGLPEVYHEEPERRFPTVYVISGFGDTIREAPRYLLMMGGLLAAVGFEAAVVFIDADCPTGHHVFADSANNGPCGTALVKELIPHLEEKLRLIADPDARYLTGASSGGWASLWLQVTYPATFGGVWSMSPDPVDFTAFQVLDIHDRSANFLRDAEGKPKFLWDRRTGEIDPQVARAWDEYDIRLILESNWKTLEPKLRGKLYLYCGSRDEFFLEHAFYKLRDALQQLESDAYIEVVPNAGHMVPPTVWLRAAGQMKAQFETRCGSGPDQ